MTDFVIGVLTGVRFWTYRLADMSISSFQYYHEWSPHHPTVDDEPDPTIQNERGLNVYKSEMDALRGSADAVEGVVEDVNGHWQDRGCGLVLGAVECWGPCVEYEFGYRAKVVRPTKFLRAWGARADTVVDELNAIWFGETRP